MSFPFFLLLFLLLLPLLTLIPITFEIRIRIRVRTSSSPAFPPPCAHSPTQLSQHPLLYFLIDLISLYLLRLVSGYTVFLNELQGNSVQPKVNMYVFLRHGSKTGWLS